MVIKRDNFKCQKCGFISLSGQELETHHIKPRIEGGEDKEDNLITLCSICHNYAPDSEKDFLIYTKEKIDGKILESFRKSKYSISQKTRKGMADCFSKGIHITKAPKGYKIIEKNLVPSDEKDEITKIFQEFLENEISLTQLSKKYGMTTSGIKKLLQNTTYLGKVKFANVESEGQHEAILDKQLFKQVQDKLKNKGWI